jgi:hypothetical protein
VVIYALAVRQVVDESIDTTLYLRGRHLDEDSFRTGQQLDTDRLHRDVNKGLSVLLSALFIV